MLVLVLGGTLINGLLHGLVGGGLTAGQIVTRTIPNEGIRRSLRNALISFLSTWLVMGLIYGLTLVTMSVTVTMSVEEFIGMGKFMRELVWGLCNGLLSVLPYGLGLGLINGGVAYIQHHVLRILLWHNDYAPWNYIRFLDYAAACVFLRKIGGGYIFTHRLLSWTFPIKPHSRVPQ